MVRKTTDWTTSAIVIGVAVVLGAIVFVVARDVIWGVIAGAGFYAIASKAARARHHPAP